MSMISYYVSQMASISGDTVYQRLEEVGTSEEFMQDLFMQLVRMSFLKRLKDNTHEKYHKYLPDSDHSQNELVFVHN